MTLVHAETDLIRRAAALMKENAEAANSVEARRPYGDRRLPPVPESQWGAMVVNYLGGPVGRHCASWSPGVAEAVADWLDRGADPNAGVDRSAMLAVARAYLGEPGDRSVTGPAVDPGRCTDRWHAQRGEPAGPCPVCEQKPFPFVAAAAEPGTVVIYGGHVVRRLPYTAIGLPWKHRDGSRWSHAEVRLMVDRGGQVTFCSVCAGQSLCPVHGAELVHGIADGSATTWCCQKTPFEVRGDRITQSTGHVTCQQRQQPGQGGPSGEGDDSE